MRFRCRQRRQQRRANKHRENKLRQSLTASDDLLPASPKHPSLATIARIGELVRFFRVAREADKDDRAGNCDAAEKFASEGLQVCMVLTPFLDVYYTDITQYITLCPPPIPRNAMILQDLLLATTWIWT